MRTVAETGGFSRQAAELLSEAERQRLIVHLAADPEAGDIIPETGGLRKLRWRAERLGRGKRGGVRVIYYVFSPDFPLYLLAIYAKGRSEDLTPEQRRALVRLTTAIREAAVTR